MRPSRIRIPTGAAPLPEFKIYLGGIQILKMYLGTIELPQSYLGSIMLKR